VIVERRSVVVGPRVAGIVLDALDRYLRVEYRTDPALVALVLELSAVSGRRPGASTPTPRTVTVTEYAAIVGKDPHTVARWCREGKLPARKRGPQWVITPIDSTESARDGWSVRPSAASGR
jgi:hypothetical protein